MSTCSYHVPGTNLAVLQVPPHSVLSTTPGDRSLSLSTWQVAKLRLREARSWPKISKFQGQQLKAKLGPNLNPGFKLFPNRLHHRSSVMTGLPPADFLFQLQHNLHLQTLGTVTSSKLEV